MAPTKASSPPGHTISAAVPVRKQRQPHCRAYVHGQPLPCMIREAEQSLPAARRRGPRLHEERPETGKTHQRVLCVGSGRLAPWIQRTAGCTCRTRSSPLVAWRASQCRQEMLRCRGCQLPEQALLGSLLQYCPVRLAPVVHTTATCCKRGRLLQHTMLTCRSPITAEFEQDAHLDERCKVRIQGEIIASTTECDIRYIHCNESPAVQRCTQQGVDQAGAAANVQSGNVSCAQQEYSFLQLASKNCRAAVAHATWKVDPMQQYASCSRV